jgi:dsDNA-specific endonuclease/ATPase MutS2
MKSVIIEHSTPDFGGVHDIAAAARLAERGSVIGLEDVFAVRETLLATARLAHFLSRQTTLAPELAAHAAGLDPLPALSRQLSGH